MEANIIILDFQQVCIANLMTQIGAHTNAKLDENMLRHFILNTIRSLVVKFKDEFGELVIACDNTNVWRKKVFPYYKANRKKAKEKSDLDWNSFFECLNKIRQELKENFHYRIIDVESAEADDIIGTLCREFGTIINNGEKILILSGDKDFIQLHTFGNVKQYDPVRKKFIEHKDPEKYLMEHVLKGDAGDGVPNVLSSDNCFVVGERQKPLTQKKIDELIDLGLEGKYDHPLARNFMRNKQIIDLSFTPKEIRSKIIEQFEQQEGKNRSKLLGYFINNRLKNLSEHINEF